MAAAASTITAAISKKHDNIISLILLPIPIYYLLGINLLGLGVERGSLGHEGELLLGDTESLLGLGNRLNPGVLLGRLHLVLAHNLTSLLVQLEIRLGQTTCGVLGGAVHNLGARTYSLSVHLQ
jgi:hypothetical protein